MLNIKRKIMKIEMNARDLQITTLDSGAEVVQIKGGTAFDEQFIEECRQAGVKEKVIEEEEEEIEENVPVEN